MSDATHATTEQHDKRIAEAQQRAEWCKAWLEREAVRSPQITNEWRGLLEDTFWLLDALRVRAAAADTLADAVRDMDCECVPAHERGDYPDHEGIVCERCAALAAYAAVTDKP